MDTPIKILIVEHDLSDLEMINHELKTSGINYVYEVVKKEQDFIDALTNFVPDIILSDYTLPSFMGPTAFKIREELAPHTPFIFVSGTIGEEKSIDLIKNGLTDFVLKDKIFTLSIKVNRALKDAKEQKEKTKTEKALKKAYEEKNMVLESIDDGFFAVDKNSIVTYWNRRAEILLHAKKEDVIGKDLHKMFSTPDSTVFFDNYQKALRENSTVHFEGFSKRSDKWFGVSAFASDNGMSVYFKDITERRNSEDKLKESELRYRSIIEQATDAICMADASMKIIDINPYGCQILGYSKAEFLELTINDLFLPEDLKANPFKMEELKTGKVIRNERRFISKDGTLIDVEMSGRILTDGRFLVFGHEIAERKKIQDKIKESELRYRSLIEQATDAICITDASLKFTEINPYGCEMLGYTFEEGLQLSLPDILFPEDLIGNPIKVDGLKPGETLRNERRLKRKDGTAVDMEVSTKVMADGSLMMFGHDITQRKKTELIIKESEIRYRTLFEQNLAGVYQSTKEGVILNCNDAFAKMLKYDSPAELLNSNATELYFSPDVRNDFIKTILHQKKLHNYEVVLKCKDNSPVHVIENISMRKNDITGELFFDGILIDSTENKKADEKIKKINRLYTFISQVNQNIVHIKDEAELFRNSCQIAFEFGKFKMAWIGLFDNARERIILADQNGIPGEELPLFSDLPCEKNGPQETVLKTGIYLCNDPEECPELRAWLPFAAKHGILSAIVLPIKKAGHIIGTFNLYASELNFFDKEEIALLIDVTEDISFALDVFQKAKQHREAEELILKNETRFRALIEKSVDMKTLSTPAGEILFASGSITKFLGYSIEEFVQKRVYDIFHPDDINGLKDLQNILQGPGRSIAVQKRMLHKNGHWIWCEGTITNMLHEPGVNALVSNFRDISEKKIAEQQHEFDSSNLNALINNTTDLMWSVDRDCKLITFNQPFFEIIKSVTGKALAKGDDVFSVVISVEQLNRFKISYARAFTGDTFTEIEHISSPVDSWSEISYYPIRQGTEVIGTACHSRNITERKRAEKEVLYTLNEKNIILESIGDSFFAVDKQWTVTYWNNKAEKMLRVPKDEILGRNLWEVFSNSIDSESYRKYHEAIDTNKVIQFEDYYPALNKFYEISAYPSAAGLSVYFKDVTERRKAEEAIQISNERYNLATKATSDIIWDWNLITGEVMRSAENMEKIFGYTDESAYGNISFWTDRIHPEDLAAVNELFDKIFSNPLEIYMDKEYRFKKANGQYAYVYDKGYIVRDDCGKPTRMTGACQDITKLRENELQLQIRAKELTISNQELEQFAYVASHDLQEPLRMVTSFLTQLEKKYRPIIDAKGKQYIDFAVDGAKRMRQIILDLLEYSRAGRTADSRENIDLNQLIEEIQILCSKQIKEKKAVITVDELPQVHAHRSPLRQIFQNLIGNALKYTKEDRPVKIHITVKSSDDHWQFAISDNGIGIEHEYFDKIFIIFQRLHSKEEFSGTGMGLAITKKIIESQGGKIWVESEEGKGSTFYFTIEK